MAQTSPAIVDPQYFNNHFTNYETALIADNNTHITPHTDSIFNHPYNGPFPIGNASGKNPPGINTSHLSAGVFVGFHRVEKATDDPWVWSVVYGKVTKAKTGQKKRLMLFARPFNYVGEPTVLGGVKRPTRTQIVSRANTFLEQTAQALNDAQLRNHVMKETAKYRKEPGLYHVHGSQRGFLRRSFGLAPMPF